MEKMDSNKTLRDQILSAQTTQFFMPSFKKDEDSNTINYNICR
jgi:hypothetical protein